MEITNEIKAKIFAPYFGQEYNSKSLNKLWGVEKRIFNNGGVLNLITNSNIESDIILILKPLSAITDGDKLWIADLFEWKEVINISVGAFLSELVKTEYNLYRADKTLIAIQYLQSKGYDLPNFLLGGKTLQESGLAIYE